MMETKEWIYYSPEFESDAYNYEMMVHSPWSGHRNFIYDYVRYEKPERIVELGSYYGCSAFAMLQAVKDGKLSTDFLGIDTWSGDSYTKKDYREDIYGQYKQIQDRCFSSQNARMLRMTFDQAVSAFPDKSIDLLHIDGSHSYEDVKHDYETWKEKVCTQGLIVFHDIGSDLLFGKKMGSHIFWKELQKKQPFTMEFPFSFGLGLLFLDGGKFETIKTVFDPVHYQQLVNYTDVYNKDELRKRFFEIGSLKTYISSLEEQVKTLDTHLHKYEETTRKKDDYIQKLEKNLQGKDAAIDELKENLQGKDVWIQELEKNLRERDAGIEEFKKCLWEKEAWEEKEKERWSTEKQALEAAYQETIEGKDIYISQLQRACQDQERDSVKRYEQAWEEARKVIRGKDVYIEELRSAIEAYGEETAGKDKYISELLETIETYEENVAAKDQYNQELKEAVASLNKDISGKETYIEELSGAVAGYKTTTAGQVAYITELQAGLKTYQDTEAVRVPYISLLEKDIQGKNAYIEELEERHKDMEAEMRRDQSTIEKLSAQVEERAEKERVLRRELDAFQTELGRLPFGKYILRKVENIDNGNKEK